MRQKETKNGLVALTDLQDAIESEMLQDLLRQEQIPVMVRGDEGSGDYLKIYMGYSMFGESLYVRAADYERQKNFWPVCGTTVRLLCRKRSRKLLMM